MAKKVLFSWVGDADLLGMAAAGDAQAKELVELCIGKSPDEKTTEGPVITILKGRAYDRAVLLWSRSNDDLAKRYREYLFPHPVEIIHAELKDPSNYAEVYEKTDAALRRHWCGGEDTCHFLLSPGTPTMAAILVLLGKTVYPADAFLQVSRKYGISESVIPFNLAMALADGFTRKIAALQGIPGLEQHFADIIGDSEAMRRAKVQGQRFSQSPYNVLIHGESGVGKERFACAIHNASQRAGKGRFFAVNCGAFPENLLDSELFGHEKGAFTGADKAKKGLFEEADDGTLFLDEIGECSLPMQVKLLRVLQPPEGGKPTCRIFRRIGGNAVVKSDVRIIAATNRDLLDMVKKGTFREDLYYRLMALELWLPPLRGRREDIIKIAEEKLEKANQENAKVIRDYQQKHFSNETKIFLQKQDWPGNVRQLENAICRGVVMCDGVEITPEDLGMLSDLPAPDSPLGGNVGAGGEDFNLDDAIKRLQRDYIVRALKASDGSKSKAASLLGYSNYQRLAAQMKSLGIEWPPRHRLSSLA